MKRSDKEKVILLVTTLMLIFTPILVNNIGIRWYIAGNCTVFFVLLLWYSYGPINSTSHQ